MIRIIEAEASVFELIVTPDTPGTGWRRATIRQLSGVPLTDEGWAAVQRECARVLREAGATLYSFRLVEDDEQ